MDLDLKILHALEDKEERVDETETLQITRGAFTKDHIFAKLVSRIAGGGMECYAYLIKPNEAMDDIVRDILIAPDQDTTSSHVWVTPEGVKQAGENIAARNYELLGWTHSHGTMSTFHSSWDIDNFRTILHEISPQTMFKKENALYRLDEDKLFVDNYRIEGIKPLQRKIDIIKKVERRPFAYSIVVNDHNEYYAEVWTKTFDHATGRFKLDNAKNPKLEIVDVDDDVEIDIAEIEDEIYQKVRINRRDFTNDHRRYESKQAKAIANRFIHHAAQYLAKNGEYKKLIVTMLTEDAEASRYQMIKTAEKSADETIEVPEQNKEEIVENLEGNLERSEFSRYLDASKKFRRFELENLIYLRTMVDFSNAEKNVAAEELVAKQDEIIHGYQEKAKMLEECADIAANATRALSRYAMEEFTDYNNKKEHKYKRFISSIIGYLATERNYSFGKALENKKRFKVKTKKRLYLREERINMFNQLTRDLYYDCMRNPEMYETQKTFFTAFANAYLNNTGQVDGLIEQHLLGDVESGEKYQDVAFVHPTYNLSSASELYQQKIVERPKKEKVPKEMHTEKSTKSTEEKIIKANEYTPIGKVQPSRRGGIDQFLPAWARRLLG